MNILGKNRFLLFALFLYAHDSSCCDIYSGTIGKQQIEFVIEGEAADLENQFVEAVYLYKKYNTPISLKGTQNIDSLLFIERNSRGDTVATISLRGVKDRSEFKGIWRSTSSNKLFPIAVRRIASIPFSDIDGNKKLYGRDLLQSVSLQNYYFKLVVVDDGRGPRVIGVKIFKKEAGALAQEIAVDAALPYSSGCESVEIGDYNFDGIPDFSIFGKEYSGTNTSRQYFFFDAKKNRFSDKVFEEMDVTFDSKSKRIISRYAKPGARAFITKNYSIVNGHPVVDEAHCWEYVDDTSSLTREVVCD